MDGTDVVRIGYRGPHALAQTLAELIENDDGKVRWLTPPDPRWDVAVAISSRLDLAHVVNVARLFVTRYPDTRVRVNGTLVLAVRRGHAPLTQRRGMAP